VLLSAASPARCPSLPHFCCCLLCGSLSLSQSELMSAVARLGMFYVMYLLLSLRRGGGGGGWVGGSTMHVTWFRQSVQSNPQS
jgi:hypothetical protein